MGEGKLMGKVAVVTGSSRGIGKAIAFAYAREGASVVINGTSVAGAMKVAEEIMATGGKAVAIAGDVSKRSDVKVLVEGAMKAFGALDIFVNNAGIVSQGTFLDLTDEDWDRVISVDLKGTFMGAQEAARQMIKQKSGGRIINMASIAALVGFSGLAHYCAAKGGVIEFTRTIAIELAPYKINVNAIGPGVIDTDMAKGVLDNPNAAKAFLAKIPLGRMGKPEEIASMAVFLACDSSSYVTGETFYVDGGWLTM